MVTGLERAHWANAHPVRAIFKEAFTRAGLPYFNPHSFRNTLVQLAYELKLDAKLATTSSGRGAQFQR